MSSPDLVPVEQLGGPRRGRRRLPAPSAPFVDEVEEHDCRDGWLGTESEPAPCPVCRPETVRRLQQQRERCRVCRLRLPAGLVEDGYRSHPECDPYEAPGRV